MFSVGQWIEDQYLVLERRSDRFWVEYVVQDRISGNIFVVKRLSNLLLTDKSAAVRFAGKAKIWINLGECEEIVCAYMIKEFRDFGAVPHLFLEYVNGPSLADIMNSHPGKALPLDQIVLLMRQVIEGMRFLHGASLIEGSGSVTHGGLHPGVVLTQEGNVKISDVGLTSVLRQSCERMNVDLLLHELPYLAPEQLDDPARADELTDVYAFGAIAYEAATGTAPFALARADDPVRDFVASKPVSPRLRNRSCPAWLEETILKCMAREPENRFQSFERIERFLEEVLKTEKVSRSRLEVGEETGDASRVARVRGVGKKESRRLGHYYLGVEHLMLGLLDEEESLVVSCLGDTITAEKLQSGLLARLPKGEGPWYWDGIIKTPRYLRVMSRARKIRRHYGHQRMLPQHLILAVLEEGRNIPVRVLKELKIDINAAVIYLQRELREKTPALFAADVDAPLGRFTQKIICSKYLPNAVPFVGREDELNRAIHSITDEKKSIIIVGGPGTGKTAFVHELECRLAESFSGGRSAYGGMYELKKAHLLSEIADPQNIAESLLDLLTSIVGAGAILLIEGLDALFEVDSQFGSGLFKETIYHFIAENGLILAATMTPDAFVLCEMDSSSDLSLFEVIQLAESSQELTLDILNGARDMLETEHSVNVEDDALTSVLEFSNRLSESALPGQALELLDHSCAFAKLVGPPGERVHIDSGKVEEYVSAVS